METGGFDFYTENDSRLAKAEQRKIEYLEARIDYARPESILHVYNKSIQEQLFKTPVGLLYLKKLQDFLLKQPQIDTDKVRAIPLYDIYTDPDWQPDDAKEPSPQSIRRKEREKARFQISVVLNVLLVLAIGAMFVISFISEQPNIFNYERAIQNKYASWEQELKEREQTVRDKERELNIQNSGSSQSE